MSLQRALSVLLLAILAATTGIAVANDGWTTQERRVLQSLALQTLGSPPANASNAHADSAAAARLGQHIFFDVRFSGNGSIACATCHVPEKAFVDGLPTAKGILEVTRNTPTLIGSAHLEWFYWDGRRDSLWSQALIPFEAAAEMGSNRNAVVRLVTTDPVLRNAYLEAFSSIPEDLLAAVSTDAGPIGSPRERAVWKRLSDHQRRLINRVYSNLGKSLEAFERTLQPCASRFDAYVTGLSSAGLNTHLSATERAGAKLFISSEKTQCLQCHNGPLLTNGGFHNIGTGNFSGESLDFGRAMGLRAVMLDEFNCYGPYSDAEPPQCTALRFLNTDAHIPLEGAFKTPSLRNVGVTAPYFHDGSKPSLHAVIDHYAAPPDGSHELRPIALSDQEKLQLAAFLQTLDESDQACISARSRHYAGYRRGSDGLHGL